jgi:hypothetical protein
MTVIISGTDGVSDVDGSAGTPAIRGTDANTGIFFGADQVGVATNGVERVEFGNSETVFNDSGDSVDFRVEGDTDANLLFVDASADNIGIGTGSPNSVFKVTIAGTAGAQDGAAQQLQIVAPTTTAGHGAGIRLNAASGAKEAIAIVGVVNQASGNLGALVFHTYGGAATIPERARITSGGELLVGTTASAAGGSPLTSVGFGVYGGYISGTIAGSRILDCNRLSDDGPLIGFFQASVEEGNISVSGSTVSYNGGHLSRWAQMLTKPDLLKGTVMSNLDEMNVYVNQPFTGLRMTNCPWTRKATQLLRSVISSKKPLSARTSN